MYIHTYYISCCTYINLHRCSSYHTQFRLLGKGTDEASSDIDISQESSETTHSEENRDLSISQSVKRQKMSEEITETEVTSSLGKLVANSRDWHENKVIF